MKKNYLVRILLSVKFKRSISDFLELGLNYTQIANIIEEALNEGYLNYSEELELEITEKGELVLEEGKPLFGDYSDWILPEEKSRIEKIGLYDVYLPRKKSE